MDQQSAIEEIALIKRVIEESREFTCNSGKEIITWGILISIAVFASYGAIIAGYGHLAIWIWVVIIGSGWIFSIVMGIRKRPSMENLGVKILSYVWTSCGIAMTILGFAGTISGGLEDWAIAPVFATIMGVSFAVTALVQKLNWVLYVAVAWWVGSLLMFLVRGLETMPIFGVMIILFMVIPGMLFRKQWRDQQAHPDTK
ncbi:MAG TPA: hypothetical protein VLX91_11125 [Candidatus Acidoferrales bacterium]|nr:hypothetical protein [Candidatus Acidoferrales bacterium]